MTAPPSTVAPAAHGHIRNSEFQPAVWLRNRHLQTIFPTIAGLGSPFQMLNREVLELPDGDVTTVDWLDTTNTTDSATPLLIVLHGLESSAKSTYARHLLGAASARGWRAAVLHFRDCGDHSNRLPRRYHAGETGDLRYFLDKLQRDGHSGPILAVGYSLGGNVLLKYLGESGISSPLCAAAAVSVPFDLQGSSDALNTGISKLYQWYLLHRMKRAVARKFRAKTTAFDWNRAMRARTFAEFDDAVTAPLHGFEGKDDYYRRCSSAAFLHAIERPTLILNARDDPFLTPQMLPQENSLSPHVTLELSRAGGHVGFISGGTPWRPRYYLPQRLLQFLESEVAAREAARSVTASV